MKIQGRIFSVIFLVQITFLISIALYFVVLLQPVARIQSEQVVLQQLEGSIHREVLTLHRILTGQFDLETQNYRRSSQQTLEAFENVASLEFIPGISNSAAEAINSIGRLSGLIQNNRTQFFEAATTLAQAAEAQFSFLRTFQIKRLIEEGQAYPEVRQAAALTLSSKANLIDSLDSSLTVLDTQKDNLAGSIQRFEARSNRIALILIAVFFLINSVLSIFISRSLITGIRGIETLISGLTEGDLRARSASTRKDEIGRLSRNLDSFTLRLQQIIGQIQQESQSNRVVREKIVFSVDETSGAVNEIQGNMQSIRGVMEHLDTTIEGIVSANKELINGLQVTDQMVQDETQMVQQVSTAAHTLSQSLTGTLEITNSSNESTKELVTITESSKKQFTETVRAISEVDQRVSDITRMTSLIEDIAAQTQLLAMNAAIEAAHAGDRGAGFAVVAHEIRKLAEQSSGNSKEISDAVKRILAVIDSAGEQSKEMEAAFDTMTQAIDEVSSRYDRLFKEIASMQEVGNQILGSVSGLLEVAKKTQGTSQGMKGQASDVHSHMDEVQNLSHQVYAGMEEITIGITHINQEMLSLREQTDLMVKTSETLDQELQFFKTAREPESTPGEAEPETTESPEPTTAQTEGDGE